MDAVGAAESVAAMVAWRGEVARVARQLADRTALERANGLTALDALLAGARDSRCPPFPRPFALPLPHPPFPPARSAHPHSPLLLPPPLPRLLVPTALSLRHPASFPSARVASGSDGAARRMEAVSAHLLTMQGRGDAGADGGTGEGEEAGSAGRFAQGSEEGGGGASGGSGSSGSSGSGGSSVGGRWSARHGGFLGAEVLLRHWSRVLGAQPGQREHAGSEEPCAAGGEGAGQGSGGGRAEEAGGREGGGREGSEGGEGVAAFCSGAGEAVLWHMDDEEPRVRWGGRERVMG
ncbi:unnamed protein product [Closterium sp. NIES-54]